MQGSTEQDENIGFKGYFKIPALFYADDGLLFSSYVQDATKTIKKLIQIEDECGLMVNKEKSRIMIINTKDNPEEI